ncbi:MAG: PqqD family protein [Syntrophomonas sp.]
MKIKEGFMLREIAGQWVVVPLGERVVEFNGIMTLNETGVTIWKRLENDSSEDDLVQAILTEYTIDEETARADIREFVSLIREKNLLS